ncbi:DEAD/DEAH box helicase [Parapedobacter tibetensis]|uniref:DEAD/DEAH box helicase n=1 Tax=Parapedobacter tibetensis TaxID=2972951 RepID=UPI00214D4CBF|nr:DEAD/DEAH box helicase [Parapedobacter tibetensis]
MLSEPLLRVLKASGYNTPTPIQEQAIPLILKHRDILGCAQTGTGKTAAFALPIIQLLHESDNTHRDNRTNIRALILSPTRELAIQIGENIGNYSSNTKIRHSVIFGGVSTHQQANDIRKHPHILVATPGRLLDMVQQGIVSLRHIEFFVLDEADRMLDMGFINDIKKVLKLIPEKRQTLLFSATMPKEIASLADTLLDNPAKVEVTPASSTAEKVVQSIYPVAKIDKIKLLTHLILHGGANHVLVFSRTKHGADKVVRKLKQANIAAEAIHGNKSQQARQKALNGFKSGKVSVLIATDIAARGIDVEDLPLVINYDLPNEPETYVHRIGRTGRAGSSGEAWSFCDSEEREYLWQINKLIGQQLPLVTKHPFIVGDLESYERPPAKTQKSSTPNKNNNHKKNNKWNRRIAV